MIMPEQNELAEMLRFMRPAGTRAETTFKTKYLTPLGVQYDKHHNGFFEIPGAPIVWSSHTDTVHRKPGRQSVLLTSDKDDQCIATSDSNCLGADCTTGVFIMMNMIRNRVPGLYLFHHSEERGCVGSKAMAKDQKKTLSTYRACIAFDRRGYEDIIRYQHGTRCCSDKFAESLALPLNRGYKPASGVWTDSGEYTDIIGECTNISVGYFNQHSDKEYQDIDFALWLARQMCEADFTKLVFSRKAGAHESEYPSYNNRHPSYYSRGATYAGAGQYERVKPTTMYDTIFQYPKAVTNMLLEMGLTQVEVLRYCEAYNNMAATVGEQEKKLVG